MQTDLGEFEIKNTSDRTIMHVLYGLHTLAWFSGGVFAVIALIINYLRRADESDPLYIGHHSYMIRTFWWTLAWLVLLQRFVYRQVLYWAVVKAVIAAGQGRARGWGKLARKGTVELPKAA